MTFRPFIINLCIWCPMKLQKSKPEADVWNWRERTTTRPVRPAKLGTKMPFNCKSSRFAHNEGHTDLCYDPTGEWVTFCVNFKTICGLLATHAVFVQLVFFDSLTSCVDCQAGAVNRSSKLSFYNWKAFAVSITWKTWLIYIFLLKQGLLQLHFHLILF